MTLIDYIILILVAPFTIAVCYLYFLALIGLTQTKKYPQISKKYNFLVLIPAHNEEQVIGESLEALIKMMPIGKVEIAVIADNCQDKTAEIAGSFNIKVFKRYDTTNMGKGHALRWGISQFDLNDHDGVAVVDADTIVKPNMLISMAESFEKGFGAVQLYSEVVISQKNHLSYLQLMANISENILFYKARSILGLPILLRGTGMGIKADVLQKHPWDSFSVTEDIEYALNLLRYGTKIDFNINSKVHSAATSSYQQSTSQKIRWASGTAELIKKKVFALIFHGFKKGKPELIELGFSFFLLSRPLLIYPITIILILNIIINSSHQFLFILWCLLLIGLLILYNILGILFIKDKYAAFNALRFIPVYGVWFLFIQISAIFKSGKLSWIRTERKIDE